VAATKRHPTSDGSRYKWAAALAKALVTDPRVAPALTLDKVVAAKLMAHAYDKPEVVTALLQNVPGLNAEPAFWRAITRNHPQTVRTCVANDPTLNPGALQQKALRLAVFVGDRVEVVKALLEDSRVDPAQAFLYGKSILRVAAEDGCDDTVVRVLLADGRARLARHELYDSDLDPSRLAELLRGTDAE
jgi:hypothetical protein